MTMLERKTRMDEEKRKPRRLGLAGMIVDRKDGKNILRPRTAEEDIDPRPEVALLLANLKAALPNLEKLREECRARDDEDVPYRLLHQSNKVYGAQHHTTEIVTCLRVVAPDPGKLDAHFEEIVAAGTGKKWELSHNDDWTRHTRPIVEAYFWTRYLLDMAIRFAREYDRPPAIMDYGWAALLTVYRLR
jgi:hypothetical protein